MLRRRYALRRYTALVLLLVAPLGAEACRHKSLAPAPEPPPKTILHVANGEFLDAVVYVVDRGQRVRLGVASSNRTTNFEIPAHIPATALSFVADPIGAPARPSTGDVVIVPGDDLELRLSGGRAILTKRP